TWHAEYSEGGRNRRTRRIELTQFAPARQAEVLPAVISQDKVAGGKSRIPRFDHLAYSATDHHLAKTDRRGVRLTVAHPTAHRRVERQIDRATQHGAVSKGRQGDADKLKIVGCGIRVGTASQDDLPIHHVSRAPSVRQPAYRRQEAPARHLQSGGASPRSCQ